MLSILPQLIRRLVRVREYVGKGEMECMCLETHSDKSCLSDYNKAHPSH